MSGFCFIPMRSFWLGLLLLSCIVESIVSWQQPTNCLWGSGPVCWPIRHSNTMVTEPAFGLKWNVNLTFVRRVRRMCRSCLPLLTLTDSVHSSWKAPSNSWMNFPWQSSQGYGYLCFWCTSFIPPYFLYIGLDTAFCEKAASLAITLCGVPSLWRVAITVYWTSVKSDVFSNIV